jgi:hypothetical protein
VVVKREAKQNNEDHSLECREKSARKRIDRADIVIALGKAWKGRNRR